MPTTKSSEHSPESIGGTRARGRRAARNTYEEELIKELGTVDSNRDAVSIAIARKLLDFLVKGNFKPGDRLPSERKLAEALGVGRSAIREALKPLALLGLVAIRQGNGSFLKSNESDLLPQAIEWGLFLGAKRTRDMVEARCHIEVVIAGLAAERRSQVDIEALKGHLDDMAVSFDDDEAFVNADVAFHLRLAEAANNLTLLQILSSIRSLLQVWISRVMQHETDFNVSYQEHVEIHDAIVLGDGDRARSAMRAHMWKALDRLDHTIPHDVG